MFKLSSYTNTYFFLTLGQSVQGTIAVNFNPFELKYVFVYEESLNIYHLRNLKKILPLSLSHTHTHTHTHIPCSSLPNTPAPAAVSDNYENWYHLLSLP